MKRLLVIGVLVLAGCGSPSAAPADATKIEAAARQGLTDRGERPARFTLEKFEQTDTGDWHVYFIEPDSRTQAFRWRVLVEKRGEQYIGKDSQAIGLVPIYNR